MVASVLRGSWYCFVMRVGFWKGDEVCLDFGWALKFIGIARGEYISWNQGF